MKSLFSQFIMVTEIKIILDRNCYRKNIFEKMLTKALTNLITFSTINTSNQYFVHEFIWCKSKVVPPL